MLQIEKAIRDTEKAVRDHVDWRIALLRTQLETDRMMTGLVPWVVGGILGVVIGRSL